MEIRLFRWSLEKTQNLLSMKEKVEPTDEDCDGNTVDVVDTELDGL